MKFLTADLIKAHLRLDNDIYNEEKTIIEMYAESAEDTVLEWIERPLDDLYDEYGTVPKKLQHAALLLVAQSYEQRSSITKQQMYLVPIGNFDALCAPYMK